MRTCYSVVLLTEKLAGTETPLTFIWEDLVWDTDVMTGFLFSAVPAGKWQEYVQLGHIFHQHSFHF